MFKIISSAFDDGQDIPKKFTQDGENISPPIEWKDLPSSAQQLALICEDPDSPKIKPYIHWVIYNLEPKLDFLPEAISREPVIKALLDTKQGKNSAEEIGYIGPKPPIGDGPHRYYFRLFALDQKLDLNPGLTAGELLEEMRSHVVGEAAIVGRYQRLPEIAEHSDERSISSEI